MSRCVCHLKIVSWLVLPEVAEDFVNFVFNYLARKVSECILAAFISSG